VVASQRAGRGRSFKYIGEWGGWFSWWAAHPGRWIWPGRYGAFAVDGLATWRIVGIPAELVMSYVYMTWRENPSGGGRSRFRGPKSGATRNGRLPEPGNEWTVNRPAIPEYDSARFRASGHACQLQGVDDGMCMIRWSRRRFSPRRHRGTPRSQRRFLDFGWKARNSLSDLDETERTNRFKSPECRSLLRQRRYVSQPRVAVARRPPWDHGTNDNEPQRGSVLRKAWVLGNNPPDSLADLPQRLRGFYGLRMSDGFHGIHLFSERPF
jgi:hypothetical protein